MGSVLLTIILVYLILLFLQLVGWPAIALLTRGHLGDRGWGLGRVTAWLCLSLGIWFLSHLKLPVNTTAGIWFGLALLSLGSFWLYLKHKPNIHRAAQTAWRLILAEELLFFAGLAYLSLIRSFNPAILDLEKFMDAGFMASYLRSATLPALDMWLSGATINYYSFGHFMGSVLSRVWLLPLSLSYNLLLAVIMGLSLSLSFSVVVNLLAPLTKRTQPPLLAGLVGTVLVNLAGNSHTFWYLLKNRSWTGYWYADATRFIERTIHEFPSYSYVVSDLHGHVWGLPLVLSFLVLLPLWARSLFFRSVKLTYVLASVLGVIMGVFVMTSTWDAIIYSLVTAMLALVLLFAHPGLFKRLIFSALIALPLALLTALPWLITFTSISEGVRAATEHSPVWQLAALWTGHVIISGLALISAVLGLHYLRRQKKPLKPVFLIVIALVVSAWLLLLLPEVIFFKDIYTGHPRANTMFKFTYQAFILMSLMGGWAFGVQLVRGLLPKYFRLPVFLLILLVTAALSLFPYFAYRDYYGRLKDFKGLNGYLWLADQYPDDYQAIVWLNRNVSGQPTILEAWGESYTTYDRVSSITGLPTVLGWRVHEWLWRGGFDIPGARTTEVDAIFNDPTSAHAAELLQKYAVAYIFVGAKERELYPNLDAAAFKSLGDVVFESGNTFIVKL